ncbi:MAG: hypothetical protein QXR30_00215 [Candidatus Woesearchaeota archaeon]
MLKRINEAMLYIFFLILFTIFVFMFRKSIAGYFFNFNREIHYFNIFVLFLLIFSLIIAFFGIHYFRKDEM